MICGFNGFGQLNYLLGKDAKTNNSIPLTKIPDDFNEQVVDFSWTSMLTILGGVPKHYGFYNGKKNETTVLSPPSGEKVIQASCSDKRCLLVTENGSCWQFNLINKNWNQIKLAEVKEDKSQEKAISCCSREINLILTDIGSVYSVPTLLSLSGIKIKQVCCGFEHSLLLSDNGILYSWGKGSRGQLGFPEIGDKEDPEEVDALSGLNVVQIAAGGWHSCAVTQSGGLYTWGWNNQGQLAKPTSGCEGGDGLLLEPTLVDWSNDNTSVSSVACGSCHTVVLTSDGNVWGCGWNKWNQLGAEGKMFYSKMTLVYRPSDNERVKEVLAAHWNTYLAIERSCSFNGRTQESRPAIDNCNHEATAVSCTPGPNKCLDSTSPTTS